MGREERVMKTFEQIVWFVMAAAFAVVAFFSPEAYTSTISAVMTGLSLILAKLCGLERR